MTNKKLLWAYHHARRIQTLVEKSDILLLDKEGDLSNFPESTRGWELLTKHDRSMFKSAMKILSAIKI